jgi:drug/metabolite transporter (DMT)-like permease
VYQPSAFIFALVAGPMPWNLPTGKDSTKTGPISGVMTYWPFGLRWSEVSFARNFLYEMPAEALSPVTSLILARIASATSRASGMFCRFSVTLWFDLELVLLLSLGDQLLQGMALRSLDVAVVVALTSYGSIFFGLAASLVILGERLTVQDVVAAAFLVTALGLSLWPEWRFSKSGEIVSTATFAKHLITNPAARPTGLLLRLHADSFLRAC